MKFKWQVSGRVAYTNGKSAPYAASWEGLTIDEADAALGRVVSQHMQQLKVRGIDLRAVTSGNGAASLLARSETKS